MHLSIVRLISIVFSISCLSGCSFFENSPRRYHTESTTKHAKGAADLKETPPASVDIRKLESPSAANSNFSDIEVTWEVPTDPVDGFVIRYGYSQSDLQSERRIVISQLDVTDDPLHGRVYKTILREVRAHAPLFLSITAYRGDVESAPSPILEVPPQEAEAALQRRSGF